MSNAEKDPQRVVIVPPTRRDGEVTCRLLGTEGIVCEVCADVPQLVLQMASGVAVVILTETALADAAMPTVVDLLAHQPAWSDIPVLFLAQQRVRSTAAGRMLDGLTNLSLLDLPSSAPVLVSAVKTALRARQRQYETRAQMRRQREAEEALREADRRKNEFIATLAHELRNPLAPIRTGLEALSAMGGLDPTVARLREMMLRQMAQLVKLVDDLLDVSRIATGKIVLQRERLDLRAALETALEGCSAQIHAARQRLHCRLPDAPVHVFGDPARLSQIASNLLNNASKYTPANGEITVELRQEQDVAVLGVTDTGAGIPADMLESIFDMFTQVNRTLDRAEGGLGIGLSLVKKLIELHGGSIAAHSDGPDRGSTFTLRLPALAWKASAAPGAARSPAAAPSEPARSCAKVLVVDDNIDAAETLAILLQSEGHDVRTEYSGTAVIDAAAAFRPDIVICDVGLPGMNGHQVATQLRADGRYASTILVALTGWGTDADKRLSREAGFDFHLVKPVSIQAVNDILGHLA